jgi:hypothetical protein
MASGVCRHSANRSADQQDPLGVFALLKHFLMLKNQAVPNRPKQNAVQVYRCPSAQPSRVQKKPHRVSLIHSKSQHHLVTVRRFLQG